MITTLEPQLLWNHFAKMSQIPRPSKKEEAIRAFYREYAKEKGFSFKEDAIGNMLISKPATAGYESAPKVILQGHVDMVCQKERESDHDFNHDPIELMVEEGWVKANQTTLGADNGIGVSAAMAILEDEEAAHGPIEVLLTVDEEEGMGGVHNLQSNWLSGDYLINLDSETFGSCCVGCAGGIDLSFSKELHYDATPQGSHFTITLSGLNGGHSGLDIDKELGNANQLLAQFLNQFSQDYTLRLVSFNGGTLRNAIPREAVATIAIDAAHIEVMKEAIATEESQLRHYFQGVDESVSLTIESAEPAPSLDPPNTINLLNLLTLLPQGVIRRSVQLPVVETSCNIGVVNIDKANGLDIQLLGRSLNQQGIELLQLRAKSLGLMVDAFVEAGNAYPSWEPNLESTPLKVLQTVYRDLFHEEIGVEVIHAGLETGLLGEHYPHLEMVSFGPTITGAHSPDERVNIESVEKFYQLLRALLAQLK